MRNRLAGHTRTPSAAQAGLQEGGQRPRSALLGRHPTTPGSPPLSPKCPVHSVLSFPDEQTVSRWAG